MLPKFFTLVLICFSSAFLLKAQDQGNSISALNKFRTAAINKYSLHKKDTLPCFCSVSPQIVPLTGTQTNRTYQGIPNAACISIQTAPGAGPDFKTEPVAFDTCKVSSVTYSWSIAQGNTIAVINGSNTNPTVNVLISGSGNFTVRLENTVTCSNGSSCSNFTYYNDSAHIDSSHCTCTAGPVTIQPTNKQGNLWTYQGTVAGTCSGQYGVSPNLLPCDVQNTVYSWSIDGGGVASIVGGTNGQTVTVSISGNGPFNLRLDGTTVCSDRQQCSNYNFYQDSAKLPSPKSCNCDADVDCERGADQGDLRTYKGVLKRGCTGEHGSSPPYQRCETKDVTWSWRVSSGGNVVEIVGADDQQTVNVRVKGTGAFELEVLATVKCNDSTSGCEDNDYCRDTIRANGNCSFNFTESNLPKMNGGLSKQVKKINRIRRDEFIALIAEGKDYDKVTIECTPSYDCDSAQKKNSKDVLLAGKLRFEWEILNGEGNFVKLGLLPGDVTDDQGDRVIFQPPYVALLQNGNENSRRTNILLKIVDETGVGDLEDEIVAVNITIITRRSKADEDYYQVEVTSPDWTPPSTDLEVNNDGVCKATYGWSNPFDLQKPAIKLPSVADNNKMVLGQWMVLEAENQNEPDELSMVCDAPDCGDDGGRKGYPDDIKWTWIIEDDDGTKGKFIGGNEGRFVIYAAPDSLPPNTAELSVSVKTTVANTGIQMNDFPKESDAITFKVFKPGVQVEYPSLVWLPENGNSVRLQSSLLYFENGAWRPALAHMGRIHFFELLNVSTEKGTAMNFPVPASANQCRDLLFKTEGTTEVFKRQNDPAMPNCNSQNYFVHSRTQKPLKEATITVYSEDYGSYGFLRSFANINKGGRDSIKGELPVYVPVPIPASQVLHPSGRAKKNIYTDNRVTVPRDVDENRIADGGWRTMGNRRVEDPQNPRDDNDTELPTDGFAGDGLSNYEEYRGFFIQGTFTRTNILYKDLFIFNPTRFDLSMLRTALGSPLGIQVHEITQPEYVSNSVREINFNFNPDLHYVPVGLPPGPAGPPVVQKGLYIHFGFADDNFGKMFSVAGVDGPAPPNWTDHIEVNDILIRKTYSALVFRLFGLTPAQAIRNTVAHEIGHALNIWHHGERHFVTGGLQSGNVDCIMRYDNFRPHIPEPTGTIFCRSPLGTGYNTEGPACTLLRACFGDASTGRGDCIHQIRISSRSASFPRR